MPGLPQRHRIPGQQHELHGVRRGISFGGKFLVCVLSDWNIQLDDRGHYLLLMPPVRGVPLQSKLRGGQRWSVCCLQFGLLNHTILTCVKIHQIPINTNTADTLLKKKARIVSSTTLSWLATSCILCPHVCTSRCRLSMSRLLML